MNLSDEMKCVIELLLIVHILPLMYFSLVGFYFAVVGKWEFITGKNVPEPPKNILERVHQFSNKNVNQPYPERTYSDKRLKRRQTPTNYIWGHRVCDFDKVTLCNEHFEPHLCICYVPSSLLEETSLNQKVPFCPDMLRVNSLEYLIITIGIAFPVPEEFSSDTDSMFTEDLEFFANIHRNSTIIMRKGCRPDKKVFEFQFGITRNFRTPKTGKKFLTQYDLENVYPSLFTTNLNFMEQNGLIIDYVIQSDTFRPLVGFPEWTNSNRSRSRRALGKCNVPTNNPQFDCYFYELGALFAGGIYLSAGVMFWLVTGLIKIVTRYRYVRLTTTVHNANKNASLRNFYNTFFWRRPDIIVV